MCVKEHESLLDIVLENVPYGIITNGEAALTPLGTIYLESTLFTFSFTARLLIPFFSYSSH